MGDLLYFHSSVCIPRQQEVLFYLRVVREKLYPLFQNIEEEVDKEMVGVEESLNQYFNPETGDPSDFYEILNDKRIDFGLSLCEMNGYVALLAIAGLYHLWERKVIEFLFKEIAHRWKIQYLKITTFDDIKYNFLDYGIDLENLNCYPDLNELRLVANVIKHGDGNSLDELKKTNAKILSDTGGLGEIHTGTWTISGVDLYPAQEHLDRYGDAVSQFWDHSLWVTSGGEHRHRVRPASKRSFKNTRTTKTSMT